MSELRTLTKVINDFILYIGLGHAKSEVNEHASYNKKYRLHLAFDIEPRTTLPSDFMETLKPISESILKSELFREAFAEKDKRIFELENQNSLLKEECARLRPFEEHFDIEMKLRHGEPLIQVQTGSKLK